MISYAHLTYSEAQTWLDLLGGPVGSLFQSYSENQQYVQQWAAGIWYLFTAILSFSDPRFHSACGACHPKRKKKPPPRGRTARSKSSRKAAIISTRKPVKAVGKRASAWKARALEPKTGQSLAHAVLELIDVGVITCRNGRY